MPLSDQQRTRLFAALKSRDWQWRGDFIYAPGASMWLHGSTPWQGDLHDFHERMKGRLQRNKQAAWMYQQESDYQKVVVDTQGLVEALEDLLFSPEA